MISHRLLASAREEEQSKAFTGCMQPSQNGEQDNPLGSLHRRGLKEDVRYI